MSGQPYKTKLDMITTRREYLANLNLRAELNDKNLQANKTYISTGQLPVEPSDNRTLTEKLGDVQRLKIDLRNQLSDITDGIEANAIVENLSPDQLVFLSQNYGQISEQMKKNYSLGVLAPIFIDYLNRYIDKFNQTKGVDMNLQQSTGRKLLANQQIIINNMASSNDINVLEELIINLGKRNTKLGKSIFSNLNLIQDIIESIPEAFVDLQQTENAIMKADILKLLNNIVQELPTKEELNKLMTELEKVNKLKDDVAITSVLEKIDSTTSLGPDVNEEIQLLREQLDINKRQLEEYRSKEAPPPKPDINNKIAQEIESFYKTVEIKNNKASPLKTLPDLKRYFGEMYKYLNNGKAMAEYTRDKVGISDYTTGDIVLLTELVKALNTDLRIKMYGADNPNLVNFYGRGIQQRRIRSSQVFDSDIDYNKAVKAAPKFIPFGRYLINKRQLDKDIIAIKRPSGSIINGLPSQRVSKNSANIIRKIIGGGIPNYTELNELNDEERIFLNKVVKATRIDDKIDIPTPNKTDDEKDINQFEILKGQILAGNDNKDLVKNFKIILLKLSKKELIPKAQVKDLLLDMATLGH